MKIINHPEPIWVGKGWGSEKWLDNRPEYCCKILTVVRNKKMSIHSHRLKTESFYCLSGKVKIKFFDDADRMTEIIERNKWNIEEHKSQIESIMETIILGPDETFFCPAGRVHQIIGIIDSKIIEVSTQHFEEDSYRIIKGD